MVDAVFGSEKWIPSRDSSSHEFCPIVVGPHPACRFQAIYGSVRDFPNVGVEQCERCKLTKHRLDLRSYVDYQNGSMSTTTSDVNCRENGRDVARRLKSVMDLAKSFDISNILDFGCGQGHIIQALSDNFLVEGLEIDKGAKEIASQFGKVYESLEEVERAGVKYDLVTLFHVIEHLYDPRTTLKRVMALVKPGGFIILETPNAEDALLKIYSSASFANFTYWSHHPYLYSHEALEGLCRSIDLISINFSGVQRYGLTNHLYWLAKGLPGGHTIWGSMLQASTEEAYANDLIRGRVQDTLWFIARV